MFWYNTAVIQRAIFFFYNKEYKRKFHRYHYARTCTRVTNGGKYYYNIILNLLCNNIIFIGYTLWTNYQYYVRSLWLMILNKQYYINQISILYTIISTIRNRLIFFFFFLLMSRSNVRVLISIMPHSFNLMTWFQTFVAYTIILKSYLFRLNILLGTF